MLKKVKMLILTFKLWSLQKLSRSIPEEDLTLINRLVKVVYDKDKAGEWTKKNLNGMELRVQCAIQGHNWGLVRSITKNSSPGKIPDRTVCKRCGKIYHTHEYINQ